MLIHLVWDVNILEQERIKSLKNYPFLIQIFSGLIGTIILHSSQVKKADLCIYMNIYMTTYENLVYPALDSYDSIGFSLFSL